MEYVQAELARGRPLAHAAESGRASGRLVAPAAGGRLRRASPYSRAPRRGPIGSETAEPQPRHLIDRSTEATGAAR
jgi:hypothetical protein